PDDLPAERRDRLRPWAARAPRGGRTGVPPPGAAAELPGLPSLRSEADRARRAQARGAGARPPPAQRDLRQLEPGALAAPEPRGDRNPERVPGLPAQDAAPALHQRLRPRHG